MTFPRERKGTTVAVACRGEKEIERGTLTVSERGSENAIETIIGNQIHHDTDNTGGEN